MAGVYRIVYTSVAITPFSESELGTLLAQSRRNNAGAGLTGLLLYSRDRFMQVLEGEPGDVRAVLTRIAADPRHTGVWTVLEEDDVERRFGDWAMGFESVAPEQLADLPGFNPAILDPEQRDLPWLDAGQVEVLIDRFRTR